MIGPVGFEDMPLLSLDKKGAPPRERISKASALRSIFVRQREDDLVNAANRAECQSLVDGDPPYDRQELRDAGMANNANINFGGAEQQLERAMAPYYRLTYGTEKRVSVQTTYGPLGRRADLSDRLSEEISATIAQNPFVSFQTLLRILNRTKFGLGLAYFPDHLDWRDRAGSLGQFYFDRQKFLCEDDQEIVTGVEDYNVTRLWEAISGEVETDEDAAWDRAVVREAIMKAVSTGTDFRDWERMQDEFKNNDLHVTLVSPPVRIVHGWVKEFDGTWSHYMTTEEDTGTDKFLYKFRQKYESLNDVLVMFPDGLGTNGKIHGVRGLLFKIWAMEQFRNRAICRMLDQGMVASSLVLQAQTEEAMNSAGAQAFGNQIVIGYDWKANPVAMPDLQRSVFPSIEMMERLRNDRVACYTTENVFDGDQRKTKGEVYAHLEQAASLNDASLDMHYGPEDRLAQQRVRRMIRRTYVPQDPGGREIEELKMRLLRQGGPDLLEAFYRIDWKATRVVRAIGAGSAAAKTIALDRLSDPLVVSQMDDVGKRNLARAKTVDAVGAANADDYLPVDRKPRTTTETSIAILQNDVLLNGGEVPVLPSDDHLAHAREHVKPLIELHEAMKLGQVPIEQMAVQARPLWLHGAEHVDTFDEADDVIEEVGMLRQAYQQLGEPIENGLRRAARMAESEEGEQQGEGPTPEQIREVEKFNEEMRQQRERHAFKMQEMIDKAELEKAIKDNLAAAQIARTAKTAEAQRMAQMQAQMAARQPDQPTNEE